MSAKKSRSVISLESMEFFCFHGVYPEEKKNGGKYLVDLHFELDTTRAEKSDSLKDTIDYSELFKLIQDEMKIPSQLIEHVAGRILQKIKSTFPILRSIKLSIRKLNPPIAGKLESVGITIFSD